MIKKSRSIRVTVLESTKKASVWIIKLVVKFDNSMPSINRGKSNICITFTSVKYLATVPMIKTLKSLIPETHLFIEINLIES